MAKFKPSDAALTSVPLPRSEEEFLNAAPTPFSPSPTVAPQPAERPAPTPRTKRSSAGHPKREEPSAVDTDDVVSFTVRIPRHHHELLEAIAREEERSIAQVTRRLLVPAIEDRARR